MATQRVDWREYARIIAEYKKGRSQADLAEEYGVAKETIGRILMRETNMLKRTH